MLISEAKYVNKCNRLSQLGLYDHIHYEFEAELCVIYEEMAYLLNTCSDVFCSPVTNTFEFIILLPKRI